MALTLQQAKDEIAKKWGLPDFKSLMRQGRPSDNLDSFFNAVSELYCQSQKAEAWEEGFQKGYDWRNIQAAGRTVGDKSKSSNPYKP